jgi:hypothetical protein
MGVVIRPAAFTSSKSGDSAKAGRLAHPDDARDHRPRALGRTLLSRTSLGRAPFSRAPFSRDCRPDGRFLAIVIAVAALTWIFALAGAAFAIRAMLVLCFATLAGRGRRIGVPAVAIAPKIALYPRDA